MNIVLKKNSFLVFDLDDTLYYEFDYLKSAFLEIATLVDPNEANSLLEEMIVNYWGVKDVFGLLLRKYPSCRFSKENIINKYRNHMPVISFSRSANTFINYLDNNNIPFGIITDGRSITQRNKIFALGLTDKIKGLIISEEFGSEKPNLKNFKFFENNFSGFEFTYIGDNPKKDFIAPLELGWQVLCIKANKYHIHKQVGNTMPKEIKIFENYGELIVNYEK